MTTPPLTLKKTETAVATSQHRRPIIGIAGHMLPNGNSVGVTFPYLNYFEKFGDVKIIIPTAKQVDDTLDLLVIPGGPDISAFRYLSPDETPSWFNQKPDQMREYFDTNILPRYIENKTPIFGICRGHQSIAALFGAKLEQHLLFHEYNSEEKRKVTVAFSKLSSKIEFMFKYKDSTDEEIKNHLIEHCSIDNLYKI